jgi:hypothetical protein
VQEVEEGRGLREEGGSSFVRVVGVPRHFGGLGELWRRRRCEHLGRLSQSDG